MRYVSAVISIFLSLAAVAQTPYGREKVVVVDSVTSAEVLKARARKWFVDTFKDANEVIQMDDAATNTIVGKGNSTLHQYAFMQYTIEVACKQGRVRYRIYDVIHKGRGLIDLGAGPMPVPSLGALYDEEVCYTPVPSSAFQSQAGAQKQAIKGCKDLRPNVSKQLDELAASLEQALKTASAPASDDW